MIFFDMFLQSTFLDNLSIEGLETKMADPREDFCCDNVKIEDPVLTETHEDIIAKLENLQVTPNFTCSYCGSGFTQEGYMKRHVELKHGRKSGPKCNKCGKLFANEKSLQKHVKTHLKCNTCKQVFDTSEEAIQHKITHTFCQICQRDFKFVSKLTKHISSIHK